MFSVLHLLEHHLHDYVDLTCFVLFYNTLPKTIFAFPLGVFAGTSLVSLMFMRIFPKAQCGL